MPKKLLCIPKILKNESNSQRSSLRSAPLVGCCVSQRYWKMKAIHNNNIFQSNSSFVVVYPKDTEKWKQFTTSLSLVLNWELLLCIPKILKNESNSQRSLSVYQFRHCCCVSQRYWKMKAIHNVHIKILLLVGVVVYPKDTEKWKQFTTKDGNSLNEW